MGEAYTKNCAGRRESQLLRVGTAAKRKIEIDEGFNVRRSQHRSIRFGKDVEDLRSHQAVACTKRCILELGRPTEALIGFDKRTLNS